MKLLSYPRFLIQKTFITSAQNKLIAENPYKNHIVHHFSKIKFCYVKNLVKLVKTENISHTYNQKSIERVQLNLISFRVKLEKFDFFETYHELFHIPNILSSAPILTYMHTYICTIYLLDIPYMKLCLIYILSLVQNWPQATTKTIFLLILSLIH